MGIFDFLRKNQIKTNLSDNVSKTSRISSEIIKTEIEPTYLKEFPNGLYPGEIVLMDWLDGRIADGAPGYFKYEYGIDNKKSSLYLVDESYMRTSSIIESLPSLKLDQLKDILRSKKIKVTGKKKELIDRIVDHFEIDELIPFVKERPLHLTEKGKETLNEYYYIVPAHRYNSKDGIYNVATAIEYIRKLNYKPNNGDISWALFQKAYDKYSREFNYGLMTNVIHNMAKQLEKEKKYRDALVCYLRTFIISLSGLSNSAYLDSPKYIFPDYYASNKIFKLIELLALDKQQLREQFSVVWNISRPALLFHYLDEELCYQCLLAAFDDEKDYIIETLNTAFSYIDKNDFEDKYKIKYPIILN
jgi:hypothetical protein